MVIVSSSLNRPLILKIDSHLPSQLSSLPPELIIKVLSKLDWRSLVRCSAVCCMWRRLILQTTRLQYIIELGASGLVNGPIGPLSTKERLSLLLARRHAWRQLKWVRKITVPMAGECQAYELVGGVFAKAMNPLSTDPGSRHLILASLPSTRQDVNTVVRNDIGVACRDFAIDPTQDLIALVEQPGTGSSPLWEVTIHLRTMSTNETHPRAALPVLRCHIGESFMGSVVQIVHDTIALFFWLHGTPRLLIWHWTEGTLLVKQLDATTHHNVDDFSLLSPRVFMTTCRAPRGALKIYSFGPKPTASNTETPSHSADVQGIISRPTCLLLPALQPQNIYSLFTSHTAPFTARVPAGAPFATSEDVRMHVMAIAAVRADGGGAGGAGVGHVGNFTVVVRNRALLKYAPALPVHEDERGEDARNVPWEEWGPANTRWLRERHRHAWLRFVHGARFIRAKHLAWPSMKCCMQVLDFNVHPLRPRTSLPASTATPSALDAEDAYDPAEDDRSTEAQSFASPAILSTHRLVLSPTVISDDALFVRPVESRLPYREVTRKDEFAYSGFMVDEERIVGLSANAFSHGDMRQVDVFTF